MTVLELLTTVLVGSGTGVGGSYVSVIKGLGELRGRVHAMETSLKAVSSGALSERLGRVEAAISKDGEIRSEVKDLRGDLHGVAEDLRGELRNLGDRVADSLKRDEFAEYVTGTGQRLDRLLERLGEVRGKLEATNR